MKNKLEMKKIIIIMIVSVFFIVGIPILINESYKNGQGYITMWNAADVLSYYGNILGSAATIIALIVTIRFTSKTNEENYNQQKKLIIAEYKTEQYKKDFKVQSKQLRELRDTILLKMFDQNSINELIFGKPFNQLFENISFYCKLCVEEINNSSSTKEDKEFWGKSLQSLYGMLKIVGSCFQEDIAKETKIEPETSTKKDSTLLEQIKIASGEKLTNKKADREESKKVAEREKYNKLKSELFKYKNDIQEEYDKIYNEYIQYKEIQLEQKIKNLYI